MRKVFRMFPLLLLVIVLTPACTHNVQNPFRIDQNDFFKQTHAIALTPIQFQIVYNGESKEETAQFNLQVEEARKKFESLMTAKLTEAGFSVIPSAEYEKVWDRLSKEQGGFFDPATGKKDDTKYEATQKKAVNEISAAFPIDAVLYPSVIPMTVHFSGGVASWDGTEQNINGLLGSTKGISGFLGTFFGGGGSTYGTVSVLSLEIRIMDAKTGADTYNRRGGIQLLVEKEAGSSMNMIPVPREELFASEERNVGSVTYATEPLFKKENKGDATKSY